MNKTQPEDIEKISGAMADVWKDAGNGPSIASGHRVMEDCIDLVMPPVLPQPAINAPKVSFRAIHEQALHQEPLKDEFAYDPKTHVTPKARMSSPLSLRSVAERWPTRFCAFFGLDIPKGSAKELMDHPKVLAVIEEKMKLIEHTGLARHFELALRLNFDTLDLHQAEMRFYVKWWKIPNYSASNFFKAYYGAICRIEEMKL